MKLTRTPPAHVRDAIGGMLSPYAPGITGEHVIQAIRRLDEAPPKVSADKPGRLLTVAETAERLGVGTRQVWELLRAGKLPRRKLGSRTTRIPESALVAFVNGQ